MSVLYVLVPVALVLVALAIAAYVWASHCGQFDDLETPAHRAIQDEPDEARVRKRSRAGGPNGL